MLAAELIRLDRPPPDFCVSVSGLSPTLDLEKLESYLREMGGPLWSLIVHENGSGGGRRWAMAFFYCESDSQRALQQCDGLVLAGQRLSTRRLTQLRGSNHPAAGREGIPASKAIDIMNHYVGFNQWSSEVLQVRPAVNDELATGTPTTDLFVARVRVIVAAAAGLEVTAEAIGGLESKLHATGSTAADQMAVDWERRAQHKKAAVTNALKAALAKLCIIRFANGKVVVRARLGMAAPPKQRSGSTSSASMSASRSTPTSSTCYSRKRPLDEAMSHGSVLICD
jgi:hypothetical protein